MFIEVKATETVKPVHKITDSEIEKFKYFRLFLRESAKYRDLCELVNEKKKEFPFKDRLINSWCCAHTELYKPFIDWVLNSFSKEEQKVPYNDKMTRYDALVNVYALFQDVFNESFESVLHRVKLF